MDFMKNPNDIQPDLKALLDHMGREKKKES
jgi:hypothetical protein